MVLKVFEYINKEKGDKKERAVDAMSVLETMQELEDYNGTTKDKLQDAWYELKRQCRDAVVLEVEKPKEEKEKPEKKE